MLSIHRLGGGEIAFLKLHKAIAISAKAQICIPACYGECEETDDRGVCDGVACKAV